MGWNDNKGGDEIEHQTELMIKKNKSEYVIDKLKVINLFLID
jgi:hypothetical protein